jgi:hypothetical protein
MWEGIMSKPEILFDYIGGNCPVQAEGTIDGAQFYFRARGTHWSLSIATSASGPWGEDAWEHFEKYSDEEYAAGWMDVSEGEAFIEKGAAIYRKEKSNES